MYVVWQVNEKYYYNVLDTTNADFGTISYRCKHPEILQKSGRLRAPSTILSSSSSLAHPSLPQPHPLSTPQLLETPSPPPLAVARGG